MLSAVSAPKRSLLTGQVAGTHQKLDQIARKAMTPFLKKGDFFPTSKEILHFEGRRGPDGLKLKSLGVDEPEHFINPGDSSSALVDEIKNHYHNLKTALAAKDRTRAAFEAAWLAHFLTDGLTPAHHYPFHESVDEMMGEKEFLAIFGKPVAGVMRGDSLLEAAKNNWKYWGVNGLMSRHVAFEVGVNILVARVPNSRLTPEITASDIENFDLLAEFNTFLTEIANLNLYGRFAKDGWTPKISQEVEKLLIPAIIRMILLSWLSALPRQTSKERQ